MRAALRAAVCALVLGAGAAHAESPGHGADPAEAASGHEAAEAPAAAEAGTSHGASEVPSSEAAEAGDSEGSSDPRWTKSRSPMPFDVMRSVQFLQDQVARGNDRAIRVQALLLRRFGRSFLEADPAVWQDDRNFRAVVLFTLSGGSPEVIQRLSRENVLGEAQKALVDGALAYVQNDLEKAKPLLASVDLKGMEPVMAAQLSLVLGQIDQVDHPADAVPHLDRARLLAPGTLIEEAALRLEAMLVDGLGDHARADRLARQYFDRYADSSYSANFEARFAAIYAARAMTNADEAMATMADVVAGLPDDRQQVLFLAVARRSLIEGNLAFANAASSRAIAMTELSDGDRARGTLYETASALGTTEAAVSRTRLDAIDRSLLHPQDVSLLDAAYAVLTSIDGAVSDAPPEVPAPSETLAEASTAPSVLARAEQALADASQDLKQSQP